MTAIAARLIEATLIEDGDVQKAGLSDHLLSLVRERVSARYPRVPLNVRYAKESIPIDRVEVIGCPFYSLECDMQDAVMNIAAEAWEECALAAKKKKFLDAVDSEKGPLGARAAKFSHILLQKPSR
jgi:hypothetical protein